MGSQRTPAGLPESSCLPHTKQTETEERQGRPLEEYTDDELIDIMANGLEEAVEQVLAARGYDRLTQEERQQLANL